MARYYQKRKRSSYRPYGVKRRRIFRRRRGRTITSQAGRPMRSSVVRNRRPSRYAKRMFKRRIMAVSGVMPKFVVSGTLSEQIDTPTDVISIRVANFMMLKNFSTGSNIGSHGNYVSLDGTRSLTGLADIIVVRGGLSSITLTVGEDAAETIEYRVNVSWQGRGAAILQTTGNTLSDKTDIRILNDTLSGTLKPLRQWSGFLEQGQAVKFQFKIPTIRYRLEDHSNGMGYYWSVGVGNTKDSTAVACRISGNETAYVVPFRSS